MRVIFDVMELLLWAAVFIISLFVLVRGADLFLENAERIGIFFGLPSFVIGVLIVGVGTSLPELSSAIVAVLRGATEIVSGNAIGSNITNILLIGGVLAVLSRRLTITKDLIDAELPFFVISTALFIGVAADGEISVIESVLLTGTYGVYLYYLFTEEPEAIDVVVAEKQEQVHKHKILGIKLPEMSVVLFALIGLIGIVAGAKYLVDSVIELAHMLHVSPGLISMTAIALGTSLPELSVSIRALQKGKLDVAIGNIFGSNAFNVLMAVGIPGLMGTILLDDLTFSVGLPVLGISSFILLIIGLARKLYRWEGLMFLILYLFFILKLMGV